LPLKWFLVATFFIVFCVFCVFTFWVLYCDALYDFRIQTMFGSSLPFLFFVIGIMAHAHSGVQLILCVVFVFLCLVYRILPVSLDCQFLIAPSVFSYVYLQPYQYKILLLNCLVTFVLNNVIVLFPFLMKIIMKVI